MKASEKRWNVCYSYQDLAIDSIHESKLCERRRITQSGTVYFYGVANPNFNGEVIPGQKDVKVRWFHIGDYEYLDVKINNKWINVFDWDFDC